MVSPQKTGTIKKSWFKSAFDTVSSSQPSPKKPRIDTTLCSLSQNEAHSFSDDNPIIIPDFHSSNWIENFAPKSILDLAVHPKKIEEVQDWFISIQRTLDKVPGPILLITGSSGVGKTETLKLVAKSIDYEINEWITPIDIELVRFNRYSDNDSTYIENQTDKFEEFLFKGSRYSSLFNVGGKRILLVEDFPNIFLLKSTGFHDILQRYTEFGKSPLIFIVTDSRSKQLNLSYNLFPEAIRMQFNICHINFNAVSTTLLKKGLKRICTLMSKPGYSKYYKEPNQDMVDSIIFASQGDIRSAVLNLHFASQKNAPLLSTEISSVSTNKKTKSKKLKLKTIGADESITLMHALGRVFNPKFTEENSLHKKFVHSPETLTDSFLTQPKNFVSFIHANYLSHFDQIENVSEAADYLSESDILLGEYRDDAIATIGLNLGIRGVMVCNKKPVGGWKQTRGSKRLNVQTNDTFIAEQKKFGIELTVTRDIFIIDYKTYAGIINKK